MQKEIMTENFIDIKSLKCVFNKNQFNEIVAIDDLTASFDENQIHFLIGNSGSGKTTLILHFNGLIRLKKGHIKIDDFHIYQNKKIKKPKVLRKKISMVFQFPEYQLFKDSVISDVSFGPKVLGIPKEKSFANNLELINKEIKENLNKILKDFFPNDNILENEKLNKNDKISLDKKIDDFLKNYSVKFNNKKILKNNKYKIEYNNRTVDYTSTQKFISPSEIQFNMSKKYLNALGIDDSYFKRSPFGLSGGQKRRVAISGILSIEPKILVFDEPTAGLDPAGEQEMMQIIKTAKKNKQTIFVVSHNMDHVLELADNIVVMDKGKIIARGNPYEIFLNKKLCEDVKLDKPKIIDFVLDLINADKKYQYLLDTKPRTISELALAINKGKK
ncbi:MAG: ATP-binding cassette domain-containing protein [Malacoplasma sp.]